MIGGRRDYSDLLDDLRKTSYNYYVNKNGIVVDINGEEINDDSVINKTQLYSLYSMAYKVFDEIRENKQEMNINREIINRALSSYGLFNYFINTLIGEYNVYGDIGTGYVTYIPYQPVADYFFNNHLKKEVLMNFLRNELKEEFDNDNSKKRVK